MPVTRLFGEVRPGRALKYASNVDRTALMSVNVEPLTIAVDGVGQVSGLLQLPTQASACFVMAHGAGAGMNHPFMVDVATELSELQIGTLRYQFPYMEQGSRRPDPPERCHATVRAAIMEAGRRAPILPLVAGGKSFGARMTSQAQAASPLPGVRGLAFLGFPLHPPKKPSVERAAHLSDVKIPMLFLQGTRDEFAELTLLERVTQRLNERATLTLFPAADHSFHVPARSGKRDPEVRSEVVHALAAWITRQAAA